MFVEACAFEVIEDGVERVISVVADDSVYLVDAMDFTSSNCLLSVSVCCSSILMGRLAGSIFVFWSRFVPSAPGCFSVWLPFTWAQAPLPAPWSLGFSSGSRLSFPIFSSWQWSVFLTTQGRERAKWGLHCGIAV
jgi:hypothetical protein